ncbi:MAG: peptidylprolyl isomerase [Bacteroidales bacterium]|nr:peptidylprolyl isomerase [Bacteroidales bacterium]
MTAKKIFFLPFFLILCTLAFCQQSGNKNAAKQEAHYVKIETDFGTMVVQLFNETPRHRDNFLKLVGEGFYDDLLFHRVIRGFMIQGGDPTSKNARPGVPLGAGNLGYTVAAEFNPELIHRKGALAAARQGDNVNPSKASSASQFYIVQGNVWDERGLQMIEQRFGRKLTDKQRQIYSTIGGAPHLDGDYTVFGQVVEGLDVIDKIAAVQCGVGDRPIKDIKMKISVVKSN